MGTQWWCRPPSSLESTFLDGAGTVLEETRSGCPVLPLGLYQLLLGEQLKMRNKKNWRRLLSQLELRKMTTKMITTALSTPMRNMLSLRKLLRTISYTVHCNLWI